MSLKRWFRRRPTADGVREEIESHVAMRAESDGVDSAAARRPFGNVGRTSGAIGSAVYSAIDALVEIIAPAPADPKTRDPWRANDCGRPTMPTGLPTSRRSATVGVNPADRRRCR